jgi:hypothetical protein
MTFLLIWGGLWVALLVLLALGIAMTPTTVATPNRDLIAPALWCGAGSFVVALAAYGGITLISQVLT